MALFVVRECPSRRNVPIAGRHHALSPRPLSVAPLSHATDPRMERRAPGAVRRAIHGAGRPPRPRRATPRLARDRALSSAVSTRRRTPTRGLWVVRGDAGPAPTPRRRPRGTPVAARPPRGASSPPPSLRPAPRARLRWTARLIERIPDRDRRARALRRRRSASGRAAGDSSGGLTRASPGRMGRVGPSTGARATGSAAGVGSGVTASCAGAARERGRPRPPH